MKKIHILLLHILFAGIVSVQGQEDGTTTEDHMQGVLSSYLAKKPEIASLGKYGDVPINYYNGQPNISVPIYTIELDGKEFPVKLIYTRQGCMVEETWAETGLGWKLVAGGHITQSIRGIRDEDPYGILSDYNANFCDNTGKFWPQLGSEISAVWDIHKMLTEECEQLGCVGSCDIILDHTPANNQASLFMGMKSNGYDVEQDMYSFSFGQYSGSFVRDIETGEPLTLDGSSLKFIETEASGTYNTWQVLDLDGFIYRFDQTYPTYDESSSQLISLSHYLSSITGPSGRTIFFDYQTICVDIRDNHTISQNKIVYQYPGSYIGNPSLLPNLNSSKSTPIAIQKITLPDNTAIDFNYSPVSYTENSNTYTFKKIQNLGGVSEIDFPLLKEITISNNETDLKGWDFEYTKFDRVLGRNAQTTTLKSNYSCITAVPALNLIETIDHKENKNKGNYAFEYYNKELAHPNAVGRDYWGYFNGKYNNKGSMISGSMRFSTIKVYEEYHLKELENEYFADREPDAEYVKYGMLTGITYPTGGKETFNWEGNTYTNFSGENQYELIRSNGFHESADKDETVTATFVPDIEFNNSVANVIITYNDIALNSSSDIEVEFKDNTTGEIKVFKNRGNLYLAAGETTKTYNNYLYLYKNHTYNVFIKNDDACRVADVQVIYERKGDEIDEKHGPGLRIESIVKYNPATNKSTTRSFSYSDGILLLPPLFDEALGLRYTYVGGGCATGGTPTASDFSVVSYAEKILTSNSIIGYSYGANGSQIGYREVTINTNNSGYITNRYFVTESNFPAFLTLRSTPILDRASNGNIQKSDKYDKNNSLVQSTVYAYETKSNWKTSNILTFKTPGAAPYSHKKFLFYTNKEQQVRLSQETTTTYSLTGESSTFKKKYYYNDDNLVWRVQNIDVNNNNNVISEERTIYAADLYTENDVFMAMLDETNQLAAIAEKHYYKNGLYAGGSKTDFSLFQRADGSYIGMPTSNYLLYRNYNPDNGSYNKRCLYSLGYKGDTHILPTDIRTNTGKIIKLVRDGSGKVTHQITDLQSEIMRQSFFTRSFERVDQGIDTDAHSGKRCEWENGTGKVPIYTNDFPTEDFKVQFYMKAPSLGTADLYVLIMIEDTQTKLLETKLSSYNVPTYWYKAESGTFSYDYFKSMSSNLSNYSRSDLYLQFYLKSADGKMIYIDDMSILPVNATITEYEFSKGNLQSQTGPNGNTLQYNYDGLGRMKSVRFNSELIQKADYHYTTGE